MPIDLTDPLTARFIARVVQLTARDWDDVDARLRAVSRTRQVEPPPPWMETAGRILGGYIELAQPSPEAVMRFQRFVENASARLMLATLGPAWRRRGVGPIRHLVEVLERPYVTPFARTWTHLVLMRLAVRARDERDDVLRDIYAPFEAVIPFASLLPPLLPAHAGPRDDPLAAAEHAP